MDWSINFYSLIVDLVPLSLKTNIYSSLIIKYPNYCTWCYFQTSFVRHNTPHPRELKAKATKLFGKTRSNESSLTDSQKGDDSTVRKYILYILTK